MEVAGVDRAADAARFDRFHLYGHSGGGAVVLAYVSAHPERVISLTLDEPAYDFTEAGRADMLEFGPLAACLCPSRMRAFMRSAQASIPEPLPLLMSGRCPRGNLPPLHEHLEVRHKPSASIKLACDRVFSQNADAKLCRAGSPRKRFSALKELSADSTPPM
jgi:pimeloyl-ACP methyl ester carboxylesterase